MSRFFLGNLASSLFNRKTEFWKILLTALMVVYFAYAAFFQNDTIESIASQTGSNTLSFNDHHRTVVVATARIAEEFHYRNKPLNNELSEIILNNYIASLDPKKMYFRASDINQFLSNRFYYDNFISNGNLKEIFNVFITFQRRLQERTDYATSLLEYPFDFELDDHLDMDRTNAEWPANRDEHNRFWNKWVKDSVLTLKLTGYSDDEIKETLTKRYRRIQENIASFTSFEVLEVFLNNYLKELDPHSAFFSPHKASNFRISMTQQLEGIGVILRTEDDETIVQSLIAGGPASFTKKIQVGDRIVAVDNGGSEGFTEIIGWRIEDVVDLIRGPVGTKVTLRLIRKNALPESLPEEVSIIRRKVKIEDQTAKKSTLDFDTEGKPLQFGIITLPTFYAEFADTMGDDPNRGSSTDVKAMLEEFTNQGVDGVVMDLRGNGGGALLEAIDLTSLFIDSGPIVQVRDSQGELLVKSDWDEISSYEGPLVVLVDHSSASASEIFAAAIQDYRRGVIVGETTFGKGSLQNVWPLSKVTGTKDDRSGTLKLSTALFYRANGISTQHLGVVPDIELLNAEYSTSTGERALDHSFPVEAIVPAEDNLNKWHKANLTEEQISKLRQLNKERMELNPVLKITQKLKKEAHNRINRHFVALNESQRLQRFEEYNNTRLNSINEIRNMFGMEPVQELSDDAYPTERIGDLYLDEALNVLVDMVNLNRENNVYKPASSQQLTQSGFEG